MNTPRDSRLSPLSPVFLLLIFLSSSCATERGALTALQEAAFAQWPEFGMCHALASASSSPELLQSLGIQWAREDFPWARIEAKQGEWNFAYTDELCDKADEAGVQILAILCYDTPWIHDAPNPPRFVPQEKLHHWLEYVEQTVRRYKNRVGAFEIWNEPNFPRFWQGKNQDFFALTKATVERIHSIDPTVKVVVGGLMFHPILGAYGYLENLFKSGALAQADALSIHPYGLTPESTSRRLRAAKRIMKKYQFQGELWVTEIGFPTGGAYPHAISPEKGGDYALKTMALYGEKGADAVFWYALSDSFAQGQAPKGSSSEAFFGAVYSGGKPKQSGRTMAALFPLLQGAQFNSMALINQSRLPLDARVYATKNGLQVLMIWSKWGRHQVQIEGWDFPLKHFSPSTGEWKNFNHSPIITLDSSPQIFIGPPPHGGTLTIHHASSSLRE
ncbi:MAG: hypothetical protein MI717_08930 [Spirochaetales bacterium]|nr:hypothetical protein [Spirochaetales bacterium]